MLLCDTAAVTFLLICALLICGYVDVVCVCVCVCLCVLLLFVLPLFRRTAPDFSLFHCEKVVRGEEKVLW